MSTNDHFLYDITTIFLNAGVHNLDDPKAIKVPGQRAKTQHDSTPPKNNNLEPAVPPQLFSIDLGVITVSPRD